MLVLVTAAPSSAAPIRACFELGHGRDTLVEMFSNIWVSSMWKGFTPKMPCTRPSSITTERSMTSSAQPPRIRSR